MTIYAIVELHKYPVDIEGAVLILKGLQIMDYLINQEGAMEEKNEEKFIACTFSSGMFEGEFSVELDIEGTVLSLFASRDDLKITDKKEGKGKLRVTVWDESKSLIALPSETLEQGRRYLRYPISKLLSA